MRPFLFLVLLTTVFNASAEELPATLTWADSATLSTPLSGIVSDVKVEVGDLVEKGQLLAALDSRPYKAGLKRAEAEQQRLKSCFEDAEREYQHAQELYDRTVLSQTDLQTAEVAFTTSKAEFHRAEADVNLAKLDLEYSQVYAPFAGQIVGRYIQSGEVVVNKLKVMPMLRLAKTGHVTASAQINISAATSLVLGVEVTVQTAGKTYPAIIQQLGYTGENAATGMEILLQAKLVDATFKELPGSFAIIILPEG